jgi:hypothetical protein
VEPSRWTHKGFFDGRPQENATFVPVMGSFAELSRFERGWRGLQTELQTKTAAGAVAPAAVDQDAK